MAETIDQAAGEVLGEGEQVPVTKAADGNVMLPVSRSAGTFIDLLEDGDLSADAYGQLQDLAQQVRAVAEAQHGKAKGSLTLKIDLEYEGEAFKVRGEVKVKTPELPRRRSVLWLDNKNDFSRFPPNQFQMFGNGKVRAV